MRINTLFLFLLMMISIISCRKDEVSPSTFSFETEVEAVSNYYVSLQGIVKSEEGNLIGDATIQVAGQTIKTTSSGTFYVEDVKAPNNGLYIKAEAEGFFPGGTRLLSHSSQTYNVEIVLPAFDRRENFMASEGVEFYDLAGTKIVIPANGIVDQVGNAYQGNVTMYARWLDPTAENVETLSPGGLAAVVDNELQVLQSYGMVGVELRSDNGEELNLADGTSAEINFPLPSEVSGEAPDEIDLWHFDETAGIWTLEGTAVKNGDKYTASVDHFSWWNCDVAFNTGILCITVTNDRGQPVPFAEIQLAATQFGLATGYADENGVFCGLIPLNQEMDLTIGSLCGTLLHTEVIGGFSLQENSLDVIVSFGIGEFENITVSGIVNCSETGAPVSNGSVVLEIGNRTFFDYTSSTGNYSISFVNCVAESLEGTITAYDLNELQSGSETFSPGVENINLNIDACENGSITNFMNISFQGDSYPLFFCQAYVTETEITIIARDIVENNQTVILGVLGFSEGSHTGNLVSWLGDSTNGGFGSLASVTIAQYTEIEGDFITGAFSFNGIEGSFAAEVQ